MISEPMDVWRHYPIRKGKRRKTLFQNAVVEYLEKLGYSCKIEKGSVGCRNMIAGDPGSARYLVTAHYDTCAAMPFPNLITPKNFLTFLLYQLLITALLFIPAVAVGVLVGALGAGFDVGYFVGYGVLILTLVMMYVGPANRHNANDNTSGVVTLLEIAATVPEIQRSRVCFVLFDLEEAGLVGSSAYSKAHKKEIKDQVVLNLDCVGDGDELWFFPTKKLRKDPAMMEQLKQCTGSFGKKSVHVHEKGFSVYPSDQRNFPYGVGICALRRGKLALYMSRIHTRKDTVLEQTNVNILRASLVSYMTCTAADKKGMEI